MNEQSDGLLISNNRSCNKKKNGRKKTDDTMVESAAMVEKRHQSEIQWLAKTCYPYRVTPPLKRTTLQSTLRPYGNLNSFVT